MSTASAANPPIINEMWLKGGNSTTTSSPVTMSMLVISFYIGLVFLSLLIIFLLLTFQFSGSYCPDTDRYIYLHLYMLFLLLLLVFLVIVVPLEYLALMERSKVTTVSILFRFPKTYFLKKPAHVNSLKEGAAFNLLFLLQLS